MSLQSGKFTDVVLYGAPPNWEDVIAVFAAYAAGTEQGTDVVQLTDVHDSKLWSVFWQMCYIISSTTTIQIPDSNLNDEIDDSRWGQLREVTSRGSPTTGTYRPYGLGCSGFVDWGIYYASGGEYEISQDGGAAAQHRQCEPISWGDLVFYPNDGHVGIVGLRDPTGNLLIIQCASGHNNVVITDSSVVMTVG